jgi:hypothetical protein
LSLLTVKGGQNQWNRLKANVSNVFHIRPATIVYWCTTAALCDTCRHSLKPRPCWGGPCCSSKSLKWGTCFCASITKPSLNIYWWVVSVNLTLHFRPGPTLKWQSDHIRIISLRDIKIYQKN